MMNEVTEVQIYDKIIYKDYIQYRKQYNWHMVVPVVSKVKHK